MSTRGRKAELKVIEGGLTDKPAVPVHIPQEMHAEWLAVVAELTERKVITDAMLGTVDAYIMAMSNARKAQKALDEHGVLVDGGKGILKQNPAATLLGKSNATIQRLAAELGLTPASRSRPRMKHEEGDLIDRQFGLFDV